jgi:RNA polymerase sigma factor (sigma-70 family)
MPPPPAELFATRVFLGPALRVQPDRRLVGLVREGYDSAFEEIVRRYRRQLERFAAAIVGGRCEDVTQDAFSKALLALRGTEAEIELRPWLYRIVRNTALNDLRDRAPAAEQLSEALVGSGSAAAEVERREELTALMERLAALPEPQRAAIVMRELEGLSHEEIAAALGVSGGAARQAIYRARAALREGLGLILPLPAVRALVEHADDAARGGAIAAGGGAGGAALGGVGGGAMLKVGVATVLVAGTVGAGAVIEHQRAGDGPAAASAASPQGGVSSRPLAAVPEASLGSQDADGGRTSNRGPGSEGQDEGHGSSDDGSPDGDGSHSGPGGDSGGSGSGHSGLDGHGGGSGPSGGESGGGGHDGSGDAGSGGDPDGSGSSGGGDGSSSGPGGGDGGLIDGGGDTGSGSDSGEPSPDPEPVIDEPSGETESPSSGEGSGDGELSGTESGPDGSP